jgi:DNA-binding transcriptional ArsR family regulator
VVAVLGVPERQVFVHFVLVSAPVAGLREVASPLEVGDDLSWHFLSNHTQVLLCLQRDPNARFRDIAQRVGITERAAQRIVADLIETGYVESERVGRRNHYRINTDAAMRHPAQEGHEIGELLKLLRPEND